MELVIYSLNSKKGVQAMEKLFVVERGETEASKTQPFDNEKPLQGILEKFREVIALDDVVPMHLVKSQANDSKTSV